MRKARFVHKEFQISFTGTFLLGVIFIFLALAAFRAIAVTILLGDPFLGLSDSYFLSYVSENAKVSLFFILAVSLFVFSWVGIYLSYRLVGPLDRIEAWLEKIVMGENPGELSVRPKDDLSRLVPYLKSIVKKNSSKLFKVGKS